jgi:WD40 repeat protein
MSPEQVDGRVGALGVRSDVYCLGATLYHLLTGHAPCESEQPGEIYQKVLAGAIPRPRSRNPRVAPALEAICLKALALKLEDRYGSAEALRADLERWLADEPVTAYAEPLMIRARRWMRRHRSLVTSAAAVLVFGLIGLAGFATVLAGKNGELKAERDAVALARDRANSLLGRVALGRGLEVAAERGELDGALMWFARAAKIAPPGDRALHRTARANYSAAQRAMSGWPAPNGWGDRWTPPSAANGWPWVLDLLASQGASRGAAGTPRVVNRAAERAVSQVGRNLWLWDTATGRAIRRLALEGDHPGDGYGVAFSEDGRGLFVYGGRMIRAWKSEDGEPLGPPITHTAAVVAISPSRDGSLVLTAASDRTVRLWDARSGSAVGVPLRPEREGISLAASPDRKTVLTGFERAARLWDVRTGTPIGELLAHKASIERGAFSPDGTRVTTMVFGEASENNPGVFGTWVVRSWDAASGQLIDSCVVKSDSRGAESLTFGADGHTLVLVHEETGRAPTALSPDGTARLLTSEVDGEKTRLWVISADGGALIGHPFEVGGIVSRVAVGPQGKVVAAVRRSEILLWHGRNASSPRIWTYRDKEKTNDLDIFLGFMLSPDYALEFSPDSSLLVSQWGNQLKLWRIPGGSLVGRPLDIDPGELSVAIAFSPDSRTVLIAAGRTARLLSVEDGALIGAPIRLDHDCVAASFSPDGRSFVVGDNGGTLRVWDAGDRTPQRVLVRTNQELVSFAFSPNGLMLATEGPIHTQDVFTLRTVRFWNAADGAPIWRWFEVPWSSSFGHDRLVFSSSGRSLLLDRGYEAGRRYTVPQPVEGDPRRLELWAQVLSRRELSDVGDIRDLDAEEWADRRRDLDALGGPLLPP